MKLPVSGVKYLALGFMVLGSLGTAFSGAGAQVAKADGDTTTSCTLNTWPKLPNLDIGRVDPGSTGGRTESFIVHGAGQLTASVADGADSFHVGSMTSYKITKKRVAIDPSELPHGYHGKRFYYDYICTQDAQVDGSGSLAVSAGEMVEVSVAGSAAPSSGLITGTLSLSLDTDSVQVPISMFVGGIRASLDAGSLSIPQGRSGDIPVTVTALGTGADANFDLYDSVPGITVTNPIVHVPGGSTVHALLHVVVDRGAPLGDQNYNLAVSSFEQTIGLGSFTLTVTPLPVQTVNIPLGTAKDVWDAARAAACERLKDLTGREVLAYLGRTIRDPDCYLAPLQLTATQTGNQLTITGSAPGNWVSFFVTTPDGLPREWDPAFTANYDVTLSMTVDLPGSLDGSSTLRVKSIDVAVQNAYLDSHNLTGDIVESLAKAFGGSQYFHPADYALGDAGGKVTGEINALLSQLDDALAAAPASGFTQLDFSLDPNSLVLTVRIS